MSTFVLTFSIAGQVHSLQPRPLRVRAHSTIQ